MFSSNFSNSSNAADSELQFCDITETNFSIKISSYLHSLCFERIKIPTNSEKAPIDVLLLFVLVIQFGGFSVVNNTRYSKEWLEIANHLNIRARKSFLSIQRFYMKYLLYFEDFSVFRDFAMNCSISQLKRASKTHYSATRSHIQYQGCIQQSSESFDDLNSTGTFNLNAFDTHINNNTSSSVTSMSYADGIKSNGDYTSTLPRTSCYYGPNNNTLSVNDYEANELDIFIADFEELVEECKYYKIPDNKQLLVVSWKIKRI